MSHSERFINTRSFRKGDPWTIWTARKGAAASPWKRVPSKPAAIRTMRLQMLRDIAAGKIPRRIR